MAIPKMKTDKPKAVYSKPDRSTWPFQGKQEMARRVKQRERMEKS